jgi:DNA-binding NarL/FixJ family response regulator
VPSLLLRVTKLTGRGHDSIIALQVERILRRQSLPNAVKRFKLTPRESEVLTHILRGKSSTEIAEELFVAETTVADYAKRLLRKTFSKNRAEMLTKILDYELD